MKILVFLCLLLIVESKTNENLFDLNKRLTHGILLGEVHCSSRFIEDDRKYFLVVELGLTRDYQSRSIAKRKIRLGKIRNENDSFRIPFKLKYPLAKISPHNVHLITGKIYDSEQNLVYVGDRALPVTERREERAKFIVIPISLTPFWYKNIEKLSPLAYKVTQLAGTEEPFSSELYTNKRNGLYNCVVCNSTLFSSKHKYNSGTGWPSFFETFNNNSVATNVDRKYGWTRTEVHCGQCKAHLGHVFDDGPAPTYQRYCMNGVALEFYPAND